MKKLDQALQAIAELKIQVNNDFKFLALAVGNQEHEIGELRQALDRALANMSDNYRQMAGRLRLQDERFGQVLGGVETALQEVREGYVSRAEFKALSKRVERLEKRDPPAA